MHPTRQYRRARHGARRYPDRASRPAVSRHTSIAAHQYRGTRSAQTQGIRGRVSRPDPLDGEAQLGGGRAVPVSLNRFNHGRRILDHRIKTIHNPQNVPAHADPLKRIRMGGEMSAQPVGDDPRDATALARSFEQADRRYGPVPIWWWSGARLDRARLRWQMEQLCSQGVMPGRRDVPGPPRARSTDLSPMTRRSFREEWWEIFLGACEDAHESGFPVLALRPVRLLRSQPPGAAGRGPPALGRAGTGARRFRRLGPAVIRSPAGVGAHRRLRGYTG